MKDKEIFLENPRKSPQLRASAIDSLAMYYKNKYGITILKNGGSQLVQSLISIREAERKKRERDLLLQKIAPFKDMQIKYARYIKEFISRQKDDEFALFNISPGNFWKILLNFIEPRSLLFSLNLSFRGTSGILSEIIKGFVYPRLVLEQVLPIYLRYMEQKNQGKVADPGLTENEINNLHRAILNSLAKTLTANNYLEIHRLIQKNRSASIQMDQKVSAYINYLIREFKSEGDNQDKDSKNKDRGLSSDDVCQEIQFLQTLLKDNQTVGYFYTQGVNLSERHFEVVLINKNEVTKPISWLCDYLWQVNKQPIASVHLEPPIFVTTSDNTPVAQSDVISCGYLGFMYLKELLKNNSAQLKDYSLRFPYYDKNEVKYFFYPSPHVLRYSQSSKYNTVIRSMLLDTLKIQTLKFKLRNDQETYSNLLTIKRILLKSILKGKQLGNLALVSHNRGLLKYLPEFRKKWLAADEVMNNKRDLMYDHVSKNNVYLSYSAYRLNKFIKSNQSSASLWSDFQDPSMNLSVQQSEIFPPIELINSSEEAEEFLGSESEEVSQIIEMNIQLKPSVNSQKFSFFNSNHKIVAKTLPPTKIKKNENVIEAEIKFSDSQLLWQKRDTAQPETFKPDKCSLDINPKTFLTAKNFWQGRNAIEENKLEQIGYTR